MKNTLKFLLVILAVAVSVTGYSQKKSKPFKGIITYGITYEGDELDATTQAQLPTEVVVSILGDKVRNEQVSAFYNMATISDLKEGSTTILFDAMGMKVAVKQTKEEIEAKIKEADIKEPEVKLIDETKEIAGYTCKKAEIKSEDNIIEVYYTNEINVPKGINDLKGFKGIEGVLMEYSIVEEGVITKMTVKKVKKGKVKKEMFLIPDDYEIKTMEELSGILSE